MVAIPSAEPVRFATAMATTAPTSIPLASAILPLARFSGAVPPTALDLAIEASHGDRIVGNRSVVFDFLDEAEAGVSTEADLIPWTPSDQPGVLVSGNDSPSPTNQRKFRDNRVLFSQVTPAMVGNGSR